MSYARNLLSRGEEVVFESRQHWFAVVARVFIWFLVLIVALAILIWISHPAALDDSVDGILQIVAARRLLVGRSRTSASSSGTGATRSGWSPRGG